MSLTDEEKEYIIEEALMTDEGRIALAQAFVGAIPSYHELGKKLLIVEDAVKEEIDDPIESRFDILDL